jgi:hypothetical protein
MFFIFLLQGYILSAQNLNVSYTDCNGATQSVYEVLGTGKVLLVASKGLDCSICMSQAPANETYAAANNGRVVVWGAMSKRYSQNAPTCMELNNWKNSYNWNNIFMFVDADKNFEGQGYPTYYVITPVDSTIYYTGNSFTNASAKATALADSLGLFVSVNNHSKTEAIQINFANKNIIVSAENDMQLPVTIIDVSGKIVYTENAFIKSQEQKIINISHLNNGIYFIKAGNISKKLAFH